MVNEAIERAGGPSALARAVGCDHSTVIGWRRKGRIPAERVSAVAQASGVPPHQLRPDLFDAPSTDAPPAPQLEKVA